MPRAARGSRSPPHRAPAWCRGEATTAAEALQISDSRMYAHKGGRRASVASQTRDVLLRTLREREPDLHDHLHGVAELATEVGQAARACPPRSSTSSPGRPSCTTSARWRSPTRSSTSPAPSTEDEWSFMRRHTIIGERILGAAPGAAPGGPARAREPRELGRHRLSGRPGGRGDPAGRAHRRGLRRLPRDDLQPPLPRSACCPRRPSPSFAPVRAPSSIPMVVKAFAMLHEPAGAPDAQPDPDVEPTPA